MFSHSSNCIFKLMQLQGRSCIFVHQKFSKTCVSSPNPWFVTFKKVKLWSYNRTGTPQIFRFQRIFDKYLAIFKSRFHETQIRGWVSRCYIPQESIQHRARHWNCPSTFRTNSPRLGHSGTEVQKCIMRDFLCLLLRLDVNKLCIEGFSIG